MDYVLLRTDRHTDLLMARLAWAKKRFATDLDRALMKIKTPAAGNASFVRHGLAAHYHSTATSGRD